MSTLCIPLFPLNTVLFPGGPLSLRIFEPRYLDMVSHCLKTDTAFGACLIQEGKEAGLAAEPHRIGTLARIIDWDKLPEGLLGIAALGSHRFAIESTEIGSNQLVSGTVKVLAEPAPEDLPPELILLPRLLEQIITEAGPLYDSIDRHFEDTNWIGYRLAEILPLDPPVRQRLLEINDSVERLREIRARIEVYLDRDPEE
jgi:hypothetical protein